MATQKKTRRGYGNYTVSGLEEEHGYLGCPQFLQDAAWFKSDFYKTFQLRTADLDDPVQCCIVGEISQEAADLAQFTLKGDFNPLVHRTLAAAVLPIRLCRPSHNAALGRHFDIAIRNFNAILGVFDLRAKDLGFVENRAFVIRHNLFEQRNEWLNNSDAIYKTMCNQSFEPYEGFVGLYPYLDNIRRSHYVKRIDMCEQGVSSMYMNDYRTHLPGRLVKVIFDLVISESEKDCTIKIDKILVLPTDM